MVENASTEAKTEKKSQPGDEEASSALSLIPGTGGVYFLVIDVPGEMVNILTEKVMKELDRLLDELKTRSDIKALTIISGKADNFIAGADVNEIQDITDVVEGAEKARQGQMVFQKIYELPFPVIAAIQGACVGGGFELALACHFRIAKIHHKTKIGLPEVKLGILPGFGGTQRLPRLIGLQRALKLILTGKLLDARTAGNLGLVDKVIPVEHHGFMRAEAEEFAHHILSKFKRHAYENRRNVKRLQAIFLESNAFGRKMIFDQARKQTLRSTGGHYPAPLKAIDAVEFGVGRSLEQGLEMEAKLLGELVATSVSKNLIGLFHLNEALKKDPGVEKTKSEPAEIAQVSVLGAGVMGGGIAQLLAYKDLPVRMKDINQKALDVGLARAKKIFQQAVDKRKLSASEMQRKMTLITGTTNYSGFAGAELVIEAIVENLEVKKAVFAELEAEMSDTAILASNTSSLSITEIASGVKKPDRVIGFHFFNPVHRMPLLEVIRGDKTSEKTTVTAVAFAKKIGKIPVVVKNSPGFLVNRILGPYINESALLLAEGATIDEIDKAMVGFGMPMGPLNLLDEIGIDVGYKVAGILQESFGDRITPSPIIETMFNDGRLGKKGGKGFYIYDGKKKRVDKQVYELIGHRNQSNKFSTEDIQSRLVFVMLKEAVLCLEEKVVRRARDVDAGMIFGTGFPPFRGGLMKYADDLTAQKCLSIFNELALIYGERFEPPKMVSVLAEKKGQFYSEKA